MFKLLVLLGFMASLAVAQSSPCPRKARAVIDLGSGSIKMNLAEVEVCPERNRLVRTIDDSRSHALALEASKDRKGAIPLPAQNQVIEILKGLREVARTESKAAGLESPELTVVGTHAYRTASNLSEFQKRIEGEGFAVKALTQKDEAEAGLLAVQSLGLPAGCDPDSMLVWDIGGGSMQLVRSASNKTGTSQVEGFNMGAESFKHALMEKFDARKSECAADQSTPNPIGKTRTEDVRTFARDTSQRLLRATLKKDLRASCVVGIGGVHGKAVEAQLEKTWPKIKDCVCKDSVRACQPPKGMYHKVQLECLARYLSEKNDCDDEIKGPYSTTAVSNLYFVLGWMDRLGIERVHTRNVNMGNYLVLDRERLKFVR